MQIRTLLDNIEKNTKKLEKLYCTYAVRKSKKGQMPLTMAQWIYKNTGGK